MVYKGEYSGLKVRILELGIIGGLITPVHSLILSYTLPVYQVRLDWLPLPCIAVIRPSQLSCLGSSVASVAQLVEHLPRKQYFVGLSPT